VSAKYSDTAELLRRYVSGAITAPEEAELERRAGTDQAIAEALAGLQEQPETDHAAHVQRMKLAARRKISRESGVASRRPRRFYYAAAAGILLLATAGFLLPRLLDTTSATEMALETEAASAPSAVEAVPSEVAPAQTLELEEPTGLTVAPTEDDVETKETPPITTAPSAPAPAPHPRPRPEASENAGSGAPEMESIEDADLTLEESELKDLPSPPPPAEALPAPAVARPDLPTDNTLEDEAAEAHAEADRKAAERRKQRSDFRREMEQVATANPGSRLVIGRITDDSGEPINQALIRLPGLPLGQRTDTNGVFRLELDAVASLLEISHPDFEEETFELASEPEDLQVTLERKEERDPEEWTNAWAVTRVPLSKVPGYALPE